MQSAAVARLFQDDSLSPPRSFNEPPRPLRPRNGRAPCYVVTRFGGFYITFLRTRELGHPQERARNVFGSGNQPFRNTLIGSAPGGTGADSDGRLRTSRKFRTSSNRRTAGHRRPH